MTEPPIIPAERLYARLSTGAWPRAGVFSRALVCPLCGALVAGGAPRDGIPWREMHAREHSRAVGQTPWAVQ